MKKKARVEDALHSTRAAVEGIVAGGGIVWLVDLGRRVEGDNEDQNVGINICRRAMERLFVRSLRTRVLKALLWLTKSQLSGNEGFNAAW